MKRNILIKKGIISNLNELNGYEKEITLLNKIVSFKDKKVLDIGCGTGKFLILSSLILNPKICVGIDSAEGRGGKENILKIFLENIKLLGINNIQIIKKDIFKYGNESEGPENKPLEEKFDIITCNFSLHHIINTTKNLLEDKKAKARILRLFRKISGLLKEGGEIFIKEVSKYNLSKYLKFYGKLSNLDNIDWNSKHQPYEYAKILEMAGFKDIRVKYAIPYALSKYTRNKSNFLFANRIANFFFSSTYYIIAKKP